MANPIAAWQEEHANFARLLDLLQIEVSAFACGDRPNYELMADIVQYLRGFGDLMHHPREDVAFARLVAHDPGVELVVNRLRQEHRVITVAGTALEHEIANAMGDVMASREALEAAAATYLVYYRNHLNVEESRIMPRAAKLLTPEDWAAVLMAVPGTLDPLFGVTVDARFRELRRQIDRESGSSLDA